MANVNNNVDTKEIMSYSQFLSNSGENNEPSPLPTEPVGLFDGEVLKQRDDNATLIKVYVTPQEHEDLKKNVRLMAG